MQGVHVHLYETYTVLTLEKDKRFLKVGQSVFFLKGLCVEQGKHWDCQLVRKVLFADCYKYVLEKALEIEKGVGQGKHLATDAGRQTRTHKTRHTRTHRGWRLRKSGADRVAVKSPFWSPAVWERESAQHYGIREDGSIPWPVLWPWTLIKSKERFAAWSDMQTCFSCSQILSLLFSRMIRKIIAAHFLTALSQHLYALIIHTFNSTV